MAVGLLVNARGFFCDRPLAEAARTITQAAAPELDTELAQLTIGAVTSINQVARLKVWLSRARLHRRYAREGCN